MNKKGFTLVELLAVVVVLGLIITITATKGFGAFDKVKGKINEENIKAIEESAKALMIEVQECDDDFGDFESLKNVITNIPNAINDCNDLRTYAENNRVTITLRILENNGYISGSNLKDIKNKNLYVLGYIEDGNVKIESDNLQYWKDSEKVEDAFLNSNTFKNFTSKYWNKIKVARFIYGEDKSNGNSVLLSESGTNIYGWFDSSNGTLYIASKGTIIATGSWNSMFWFNGDFKDTDEFYFSNFDTSNITDMSYMFRGSNASIIDLSGFDTSNVTNMSDMFYNCYYLKSLNISNFDTRKVSKMSSMFYNCSSLKELDLSSFTFDKTPNVISMFGGWNINITPVVFVNSEAEQSLFKNSRRVTSSIDFKIK